MAFVLLALTLGGGAAMLADQPAETLPGFKPNNLFEARGVDTINIFSGDLGIPIALGPEYQLAPGFSWQLKAYYSAKFWKLDASCLDPTDPNLSNITHAYVQGYSTLGAGWTLELGYVNGGQDVSSDGGIVNYVYHSPDGGRHGFGGSGGARSLDGSNLRLTELVPAGTGYKVEFPDGIVQTFAHKYFRPQNASSKDFNDVDWNNVVGYPPGQETPRWGLAHEIPIIEAAIEADIQSGLAGSTLGGTISRRIIVDGKDVIYRVHPLGERLVNVGTYFPPHP